MMLDVDDDPLFSEWSKATQPAAYAAHSRSATGSAVSPSLAPYELSFEEYDEPVVHVPPERRERLQRYVKGTVAGCVVLCLAAMVRVGVSRAAAEAELHEVTPAAVAAATPAPAQDDLVVAPQAPQPPPAAESAQQAAEPMAASAPVPTEPLHVAVAPSAVSPALPASAAPDHEAAREAPDAPAHASEVVRAPAAAAAPAPSPAPSIGKTAAQQRELARRSLERGKLKDAVAAAEQATAADPADAEAWLILGAAQQELGHASAARVAFTTCATSAKHGPIGECRAMLR